MHDQAVNNKDEKRSTGRILTFIKGILLRDVHCNSNSSNTRELEVILYKYGMFIYIYIYIYRVFQKDLNDLNLVYFTY